MTARLLLLLPPAVVALALLLRSGAPDVRAAASQAVDFKTQILPILQPRCRPCHFEGGKMYQALPFDRSETIRKLGDKMFTRIKDPKEQEVLRAFLAARRDG
jgi:hypothetical protein